MKRTWTRVLSAITSMIMIGTLFISCSQAVKDPYSAYDLSEYVTLGEYIGLKADPALSVPAEVTDEDVKKAVDGVLLANATSVDITDRAAKLNDTVNIDFTGYMDGEKFEGGEGTTDLVLGSGKMISGFEDGLIGASIGDPVTLDLSFPDPYTPNPDYAGKPVKFDVKINSIKESILPEYNDAFVEKSVDGFKTVAEYEASLRIKLADEKKAEAEYKKVNAVWEQVIANSTIKSYPESDLEKKKATFLEEYEASVKSYMSMTLDEYLSTYVSVTKEEFMANIEDTVKKAMAEEMILYSIIRKEGIMLTDAEYKDGAISYAEKNGYDSVEKLESEYNKEQLTQWLLFDKTLLYLAEKSVA